MEDRAEAEREMDGAMWSEEFIEVPHVSNRGLKHQDPLSLEAFFLDELSREIGYETDEDALIEELPSEREHVRKCDIYYEETIPQMTDEEFRTNFRVDRETLASMVDILGEREGNPTGAGLVPTPREKQLLLTLFYLGSTLSFRKVATQFEMSMSTAWEFVDEIIERLTNLKELFIRLPVGPQMLSTVESFRKVAGVKGVLGAVADCHIPIRKPMYEPNKFANCKGFFSFHMMTVCDASNRLTDVYVGSPGSLHESEVLDGSPLAKQLANDAFRDVYLPGDCFLVGGVSLPLRPWLMTPFRSNRVAPGDKKHYYNQLLTDTVDVSRRALSVLKARFRRLSFVDTKSVKKAVMLTCAACVLHNMCLSLEDKWAEELVEEEADPTTTEDEDQVAGGGLAPMAAHRWRKWLVDELWNQQVG
ncbi:putative nuclease HARBI1 [Pollicipes pollicipes]|uniref:putative nuclease HARBI1 n=1 Tax=Pollicipes pollicipes TaxID=41117 RepID=UPI001884B268|nr:putative nuclease HARBI1 [Pollicipes pollicipes]